MHDEYTDDDAPTNETHDEARAHEGRTTGRRGFLRGTTAAVGAAAGLALSTSAATAQSGPDYGGWFDGTSNFDGTYDFTGKKQVTVTVGASGNGGDFAFSPAAIRVDPGTTVVWEWTGKGGGHNVVADDGSFESELQAEAGATFEHEFGSEGTFKYFCTPHKSLGMKGAVVVGGSGGKDPSSLQQSSDSGGENGGESGGSDGGSTEGGSHGGGGGGGLSLELGSLVTVLLAGILSPIAFGIFLLLDGSDDAEPPVRDE